METKEINGNYYRALVYLGISIALTKRPASLFTKKLIPQILLRKKIIFFIEGVKHE